MKFLTAGFFMGLVFLICLSFTNKKVQTQTHYSADFKLHKIDTLQYPSETHLKMFSSSLLVVIMPKHISVLTANG